MTSSQASNQCTKPRQEFSGRTSSTRGWRVLYLVLGAKLFNAILAVVIVAAVVFFFFFDSQGILHRGVLPRWFLPRYGGRGAGAGSSADSGGSYVGGVQVVSWCSGFYRIGT